jgi:hypothetical protein
LPAAEESQDEGNDVGRLSIKVIGWSTIACSATLALLAVINDVSRWILAGFSVALLVIACSILFAVRQPTLNSESRE